MSIASTDIILDGKFVGVGCQCCQIRLNSAGAWSLLEIGDGQDGTEECKVYEQPLQSACMAQLMSMEWRNDVPVCALVRTKGPDGTVLSLPEKTGMTHMLDVKVFFNGGKHPVQIVRPLYTVDGIRNLDIVNAIYYCLKLSGIPLKRSAILPTGTQNVVANSKRMMKTILKLKRENIVVDVHVIIKSRRNENFVCRRMRCACAPCPRRACRVVWPCGHLTTCDVCPPAYHCVRCNKRALSTYVMSTGEHSQQVSSSLILRTVDNTSRSSVPRHPILPKGCAMTGQPC